MAITEGGGQVGFCGGTPPVGGRVYGYGYRWDEVALEVPEVKRNVEISVPRPVDLDNRPPVYTSLGCHVQGAALPHGDPKDPWTTLAGVGKRFAIKTPEIDRDLLKELNAFVKEYVEANYVPLGPDFDDSVKTWLEQTSYPLWRKDELLKVAESIVDPDDPKHFACKLFMKDEGYPDLKYVRGINSRTDAFKTMVGPIFKGIEKTVYQDHHFIKHVPVADRPKYIVELLAKFKTLYASDFSAFEALFVKLLMINVEFVLYEHMTKNLPGGAAFMRRCREVLAGVNKCDHRDFTVWIEAVRMSGEMCTSLGNGFSNLMFQLFCNKKAGATVVDCVVEGDDGLVGTNGPIPDVELFKKLGLIIKLEPVTALEEASFCGLVFDREDLLNISEPFKVLANFGWTCNQYRNSHQRILSSLLRCKALSLAHIYPGCPIISALAQYGLRVTASVPMCKLWKRWAQKDLNMWERERLRAILEAGEVKPVVPPMNTRFLMERKFGVSVEEQLRIEAYLDSLRDLQPLHIDPELFPSSWRWYYDRYVGAGPLVFPSRVGSGCPPCFSVNCRGRLSAAATGGT